VSQPLLLPERRTAMEDRRVMPKSWDEGRWLSVEEIAAYLGVQRDTVYKWVRLKGMPHRKVGRLVKFRKAAVDKWIESGKAAKPPRQAGAASK
jgi:excisionase family DNA binding protein